MSQSDRRVGCGASLGIPFKLLFRILTSSSSSSALILHLRHGVPQLPYSDAMASLAISSKAKTNHSTNLGTCAPFPFPSSTDSTSCTTLASVYSNAQNVRCSSTLARPPIIRPIHTGISSPRPRESNSNVIFQTQVGRNLILLWNSGPLCRR